MSILQNNYKIILYILSKMSHIATKILLSTQEILQNKKKKKAITLSKE